MNEGKKMNKLQNSIGAILLLVGTMAQTQAAMATIDVPDFSFENQVLAGNAAVISADNSWKVLKGSVNDNAYIVKKLANTAAWDPASVTGSQFSDFAILSQNRISVYQVLGLTSVEAGKTYQLTVDICKTGNTGTYPGNVGDSISMGLYARLPGSTDPSTDLLIASRELVSGTDVPARTLTPFTLTTGELPIAAIGCPLEIVLGAQLNGPNAESWGFDNVRLSGDVIPEPGTLALLASGLLAYAWRKRK